MSSKRPDYRYMTLMDCLHQTVYRHPQKPCKQIADEMDVRYDYLRKYVNPDPQESNTGTGMPFPLKKLIPLIRTTNDFTVLDFIEQSLGRVAFKLPPASDSISDVCRLTIRSVAEFGDLMAEIEKAVADDKITDEEQRRILREGYEAVQAITTLLQAIEKK